LIIVVEKDLPKAGRGGLSEVLELEVTVRGEGGRDYPSKSV
jgi:hypothetical protein